MSFYGENLKLKIFGASHSEMIGMSLDGIPSGFQLNMTELERFMERRKPGKNEYSSQRCEADIIEFESGLIDGITNGGTIRAFIKNTDIRPQDYNDIRHIPRPGHADYTAWAKYGDTAYESGGGKFSGRLTAVLCIAGGICVQLLKKEGVDIISRIYSIFDVCDRGELSASLAEKPFPTVYDECGKEMCRRIMLAKSEGDSVGGIVECKLLNLPVGLGDAMFQGLESRIASAVFGIPAVKGIEFGAGFRSSGYKGSENNDAFCIRNGRIETLTNNCGGILGGISNGMPLVFRTAFKPTPSIAKRQQSVDLKTMQEQSMEISGRHDPCIVPRACVCVEAATALAIYDAWLD